MEENGENTYAVEPHLLGGVTNLLECLNDKDDSVRYSIEASLSKISEKCPGEVMHIICTYKQKHQKLGEPQTATLLRVLEKITTSCDTSKIRFDIVTKVIELSVTEMVRSVDRCVPIQKPALEVLVAIGRDDCARVMNFVIQQIKPGQISHFMILQCIGSLAGVNINGILEFIKPFFSLILPTLGMIKQDHMKQAYTFAIGRFCETILENLSQDVTFVNDYGTEIAIAYEHLLYHWLPSREPVVSQDILQSLSLMFPLLPADKIVEQVPKVIPLLLSMYRRSIDRISITQFIAAILKTIIKLDNNVLDSLSDNLINSLFDLVCVTPDYEKPQTVKGHYEVLRCFDILFKIYYTRIIDMMLVQLRSNNERERSKSLLLLTHLTNTSDTNMVTKTTEFRDILIVMINSEKSIKLKLILLKTIVAFIQKNLITDVEFIRFIVRNCCAYNKQNSDLGTADEYYHFNSACINSLIILSSTVHTIDNLLKVELIRDFMLIEYSDAISTISKSLTLLLGKDSTIQVEEQIGGIGGDGVEVTDLPTADRVFIRALILLGNVNEKSRSVNILTFLKNYGPNLNKHLTVLWNSKIPELISAIEGDNEEVFVDKLLNFFTLTMRDIDDSKFNERICQQLVDQVSMYVNPAENPASQIVYKIPNMNIERGMLLKLLGTSLCLIVDATQINSKIEFILSIAKLEKLEKNIPSSTFQYRLSDAAKSLGYISRTHLDHMLVKLQALVNEDLTAGEKKTTFFANLNFIKDAQKDIDSYKTKLLLVETFGYVIQFTPNKLSVYKNLDDIMLKYLMKNFTETKDFTLKTLILTTLISLADEYLKLEDNQMIEFTSRDLIMKMLIKCEVQPFSDNLKLFPIILKLSTYLIQVPNNNYDDLSDYLHIFACSFFTCAQQLKTKFTSTEDDERNSVLANYLNNSLPELNLFIRTILEQFPSPSTLDDINGILENWLKDKNKEVRICAGHILNHTLDIYIKTMRLGCEAPSKFNQTGSMLAKIVPRCIDSNATVRQTAIDILRKTLEISCVYDTLTIADHNNDWVNELEKIHDEIVTDDAREIYRFASEIAKVIGARLSNFQHLSFCKTLLYCLNDPEQSSAIGSSVVFKYFITNKGSELFHAIPELVKESLHIVKYCENIRAKSGVLKGLVALTKHHPKMVANEILNQILPYEDHVVDYWQIVALDLELFGIIIDNFLGVLSSSCMCEHEDSVAKDRQKIATVQPFAILCALKEMFLVSEVTTELKIRFSEIFSMLLITLATYVNIAPPISAGKTTNTPGTATGSSNTGSLKKGSSSKFGFITNRDLVKMNPCQIVLETFITFLGRLEMEQVSVALTANAALPNSQDLRIFIEMLTPLATGLSNQLSVNSSSMKQTITALNKYISSPYEPQRIAALGFYSQVVPLGPCGEISSVIMLHLHSSLNDPNPLVRGLCIRGLGFVGNLTEHDQDKYSEIALSSLLKGIDDYNGDCIINIPLESMRGLSHILKSIQTNKFDTFQVSMSIRIRPFFENISMDIREAAIILFGDLCQTKLDINDKQQKEDSGSGTLTDALKEQIFSNLIAITLHLSETDPSIVRASKYTLRRMCTLLNMPKINKFLDANLIDHLDLNYDHFIIEFIKLFGLELTDSINDFIESSLPYLKSNWPELRGNAAIIIGMLYNMNTTNQQHLEISYKIVPLLRDENANVKIKATKSLSYIFGNGLSICLSPSSTN